MSIIDSVNGMRGRGGRSEVSSVSGSASSDAAALSAEAVKEEYRARKKALDNLLTIQLQNQNLLNKDRIRKETDSYERSYAQEMRLQTEIQNAQKVGIQWNASYERKFREDEEKRERIEKIELETELHKKRASLKKQEKEAELELDKAILKDESASKSDKKAASKDINSQAISTIVGSLKDTGKNIEKIYSGVQKLIGSLDTVISKYSDYQNSMNTRLQGSSWANSASTGGLLGTSTDTFSYLQNQLIEDIGLTPYVKITDVIDSMQKLTDAGVSYNLEQRSFLSGVSKEIATTFDAANGTLLRIIRIQSSDSTAARLGMESYLTQFLNSMYEDTEYLSDAFDSVTSALLEAESTMTTENATGFEYVVQKWLGSMYSNGVSTSTVNSLSSALGYLGSGDISSLSSSSGMENLLVMAASKAGLSFSDLLTNGLDSSDTNRLMKSVVEYLQDITDDSSNLVVLSQYASIFGMTMSDLESLKKMTSSEIDSLYADNQTYSDDIDTLKTELSTIGSRMGMATKVANMLSNLTYDLGSNIAENPALAAIWQITSLIQDNTGGIAIPTISVLGSSVDLNTTAENLIKTGLVGISTFSMISDLFGSLNTQTDFGNTLANLGIGSSATSLSVGSGLTSASAGQTTSKRTYVGNSSGSDLVSSATNTATTEAENQLSVKTAESTDYTANDIYEFLSGIFNPQMNAVVSMLGSLSGYSMSTATSVQSSEFSEGNTNVDGSLLLQLGKTVVSVASPSGESDIAHLTAIDTNVGLIYALLESVTAGGHLNVSVENYGLSGTGVS